MAWDDMFNSDEHESNEWVTGDKNFEALNSLRDKLFEHSIHMLMDARFRTELISDTSIPMDEKVSDITEMLEWATEMEWYEECAVLYKMIKQIKESPHSHEPTERMKFESTISIN
jgi:hypothetical protein